METSPPAGPAGNKEPQPTPLPPECASARSDAVAFECAAVSESTHEDPCATAPEPTTRVDWDALIQSRRKTLCKYAFVLVHSREDAKDLVQAAFQQLFHKTTKHGWQSFGFLPGIEIDLSRPTVPARRVRAYLFKAVKHHAMDLLRRRQCVKEEHDEEAIEQVESPRRSPEDQMTEDEDELRVSRAMRDLPEDESELIRLKVCEDVSYEALAWGFGVTQAVIRSRLARGLAHLRKQYELREKSEVRHHVLGGKQGGGPEGWDRRGGSGARAGRGRSGRKKRTGGTRRRVRETL